MKNILLKHLETAPKEILGNFPRLSRDGALTMINNTEKNLAQGQEGSQKIPSLFELNITNRDEKEEGLLYFFCTFVGSNFYFFLIIKKYFRNKRRICATKDDGDNYNNDNNDDDNNIKRKKIIGKKDSMGFR